MSVFLGPYIKERPEPSVSIFPVRHNQLQSEPTLDEHERLRYIEYFQKKLLREGTEHFLSEQKQWFQLNRSRIAAEYDAIVKSRSDDVSALDNPFLTHQDQTEYDSVFTRLIFEPILSKAHQASSKLGYLIRRPVVLANAPSVEPTPAGVPSTDSHILFIGQGTFSFCNYWAKVFTAAIYTAGTISKQGGSKDSVAAAIGTDPVILQTVRLVLRYVRSESLIGFGKFKEKQHLQPFRVLLVTAMETFIVGHELAHFFLHEKYPELNGVPPGMTPREVELLCDALGFAICAVVGETDKNEVSRHLIGPLLLLYALKLTEDVQNTLLDLRPQISDTHPGLSERIQSLFMFAKTTDPTGSLSSSMEEALGYAVTVGAHVKTILMSIQDESISDA